MISIRAELKKLMRPLQADEYALLEANILAEGVRDPISVWMNEGAEIVLDGHNRHEITERHGLECPSSPVPGIHTLDDAMTWIIKHQLGKRNLTPAEISYFRGLDYLQAKKPQGGDKKSKGHFGLLIGNTAEVKAKEHKVAPKTIQRDAEFATAVDSIAESVGDEAKGQILARDAKINRKDVPALARAAKTKPEEVKAVLSGKKPVSSVVPKKKAEPKPPKPNPEIPLGRVITQSTARGLLLDLGAAVLTSLGSGKLTDEGARAVIWQQIRKSNARRVGQALVITIEEWPVDGVPFFIGTVQSLKEGNGNGGSNRIVGSAAPQPGKYAGRSRN